MLTLRPTNTLIRGPNGQVTVACTAIYCTKSAIPTPNLLYLPCISLAIPTIFSNPLFSPRPTSSNNTRLPSAPPKSCPASASFWLHVPASWNPSRTAARALLLQSPFFPFLNFRVSSSEISCQMQQASLEFLQVSLPLGESVRASDSPPARPCRMSAMSLPTGVVAPFVRRSPIKTPPIEPSSGLCGMGRATGLAIVLVVRRRMSGRRRRVRRLRFVILA